MEMITNVQEIRRRLEQYQASKNPQLSKTMPVSEMRRLLGVKKTESYWLVHRNFFKTEVINGQMRVDLESFEKWYANQVKHKKVNGEPPGAELKKTSYSFREAANLLGVHDSILYDIWNKENLETITVDFVKRIPKDVFENWYEGQDKYHRIGRIPTRDELEADYILLEDAAELLKVSKEEMIIIARSKKYKDILDSLVHENKRWISRESLQRFLNVQSRYKVSEKVKKEVSGSRGRIGTKKYLSREEAAVLAGVTGATITKWMQAGYFSGTGAGKVLRIRRKDFLQWLEKNREE